MDDASRTLIGVERDVQHIREILDRIETFGDTMKLSTLSLLTIFIGLGLTAMATADELSDIERDAKALELYLQDQEDSSRILLSYRSGFSHLLEFIQDLSNAHNYHKDVRINNMKLLKTIILLILILIPSRT